MGIEAFRPLGEGGLYAAQFVYVDLHWPTGEGAYAIREGHYKKLLRMLHGKGGLRIINAKL